MFEIHCNTSFFERLDDNFFRTTTANSFKRPDATTIRMMIMVMIMKMMMLMMITMITMIMVITSKILRHISTNTNE